MVCGVATCHIVITCTYRPRSVHVLHIHDIHTCTRLTAHVYMVLFVIIMQYLYSIYMYPTRSTLGGGTYVDSKMLLFTALIKSDSRLQCMYVWMCSTCMYVCMYVCCICCMYYSGAVCMCATCMLPGMYECVTRVYRYTCIQIIQSVRVPVATATVQ